MESAVQIARVAALLGDPARAAMLWLLIDGRARPAGELAFAANVSAQSASGHLSKLVEAELLRVETQGRHRYYCLANHTVGIALESLAAIAPQPAPRPLPASMGTPLAMRFARSCYDHLAGELAVQMLERFEESGLLSRSDKQMELSAEGEQAFSSVGIDLDALRGARRQLACGCLDWSERRFHLGGALGAALLQAMVERKWLLRGQQPRVLQLTPRGRQGLKQAFGLEA
ncbi:helix-turn-helix transcriptional regulator [Noviherbaspirillum sp. CPCC 100848]|uniref:Helix-turn-helix transcriptional regulator n=1 Tax=Noviherbaspirillum album TaxID=3080276 RepID=A0ABU6J5Y1_9BURK|nr:helix-turn-helix transcriptional regulator [Noviherbaspirillum sp. CPCC 100848]MEC4718935.1 helix-turn-helix transcriptional regulator [Noviherbaspirillum sp. CPCC 100848]